MEYRDYGRTGLKLSILGFGCMRLPVKDGNVVEDEAVEMLRWGIDHGINYLDTAYFYCNHQSEVVVGKALKDGYRKKIVLSTKNPVHEPDGKKWREHLETQLKKLDVDKIDVYHFHGIGWEAWTTKLDTPNGPASEMRKAIDEGIVGHAAFSFHDAPESLPKLVDTGFFEGVLLQYNLLDRANEDGIAYAKEKGLGVVVMGPVGGGRLSAPSGEIAKLIPGPVTSTPDAALRFVMGNPNVTVALSGMSTLGQVKENVATAETAGVLSAADLQRDRSATRSGEGDVRSLLHRVQLLHAVQERRRYPARLPAHELLSRVGAQGVREVELRETQDEEGRRVGCRGVGGILPAVRRVRAEMPAEHPDHQATRRSSRDARRVERRVS